VDNQIAGMLPLFPESASTMTPQIARSKASGITRLANQIFADAIAEQGKPSTIFATDKKPFDLHAGTPLPSVLRVYTYTLTTHPSERQTGAYRIQITLPESANRHFDHSDEAFIILAGYQPDLAVFALWDADAHDPPEGISQSKGVQVHQDCLLEAAVSGIAQRTRRLRGWMADETVVAARPDRLTEAVILRWNLYIERLTA
jgi:hypothetical protein